MKEFCSISSPNLPVLFLSEAPRSYFEKVKVHENNGKNHGKDERGLMGETETCCFVSESPIKERNCVFTGTNKHTVIIFTQNCQS